MLWIKDTAAKRLAVPIRPMGKVEVNPFLTSSFDYLCAV